MSFFEELKRRNVIRVGIAYGVASWLLLQLADVLIDLLGLSEVAGKYIVLVMVIGFIPALIFAWAFEVTPEGVKREKDVDRSQSIAPQTGKKLDRIIFGVLTVALGYFIYESRFSPEKTGAEPATSAQNVSAGTSSAHSASSPQSASTVASNDNSIAVLPFANRSRLDDDEFFTDGIHDDLLTQLAKISGLKVISRTSVMKFKDTQLTIPEIAKELGVSTILEGGIQRAGKRIRINAQLINVATDEHLWAETFDREMTIENIFDIQTEIARQIVTAVRGELTEAEVASISRMPTDSLPAYEAYLHARSLINQGEYTGAKYIAAEEWLNKAVEYDPEFALAWTELVITGGQAIWLGFDDNEARFRATYEALEKAEAYGPDLPDTLAAKAEVKYRLESDFHAAKVLFAQASAAKPGDAALMERLATAERRTGDFEAAVTHLQMAIELDPENLFARTTLLGTLVPMRAYDRAELLADLWMEKYPQNSVFPAFKASVLLLRDGDVAGARAFIDRATFSADISYQFSASQIFWCARDFQALIDLNTPLLENTSIGLTHRLIELTDMSAAYRLLGETQKAAEFSRKAIELAKDYQSPNPNNMAWVLDGLARAYAASGNYDKALESSSRAQELKPESQDSLEGPWMSNTHALMLGLAGQRDAALAEIERLLTVPAGLDRWDLYLNPTWDFFRDDERFNTLIRPPNLDEAQK